ncbi:MAG: acetylglutamate kinase [Flavobacterium sp.]
MLRNGTTRNLALKKPIAVIKVGGDVLLGELERRGLAENIGDLVRANWRIVILHGGGPQVDKLQQLHGLKTRKVGGRRITSPEDLVVIKQGICGEVNVNLVQLLQDSGINAFGCSGNSGKLIQAIQRAPRVTSGAGSDAIDFGEVGDVIGINTSLIQHLMEANLVPVIATLGVEVNSGRVFNINADTTVVEIAKLIGAQLLLLTTSIGAIFEDLSKPETRIKKINSTLAVKLINTGIIQGGMIPKVEEALKIPCKVAIVGPQQAGAFISIAEGGTDFGTTIDKER